MALAKKYEALIDAIDHYVDLKIAWEKDCTEVSMRKIVAAKQGIISAISNVIHAEILSQAR
jgi:hypothetical protein